jgi:hypothetical protein
MRVKIQLMLEQDKVPDKKQTAAYKKPSIEERVKDAICMCDSGHDSREEWEFLRRVYNALMKIKKPNERHKALIKQIVPVLRKHQSASGSTGPIDFNTEKLADAGALFNYED